MTLSVATAFNDVMIIRSWKGHEEKLSPAWRD
jgi:hypothetical protein